MSFSRTCSPFEDIDISKGGLTSTSNNWSPSPFLPKGLLNSPIMQQKTIDDEDKPPLNFKKVFPPCLSTRYIVISNCPKSVSDREAIYHSLVNVRHIVSLPYEKNNIYVSFNDSRDALKSLESLKTIKYNIQCKFISFDEFQKFTDIILPQPSSSIILYGVSPEMEKMVKDIMSYYGELKSSTNEGFGTISVDYYDIRCADRAFNLLPSLFDSVTGIDITVERLNSSGGTAQSYRIRRPPSPNRTFNYFDSSLNDDLWSSKNMVTPVIQNQHFNFSPAEMDFRNIFNQSNYAVNQNTSADVYVMDKQKTEPSYSYSTCLRSNSALPKIDLIPKENEFDLCKALQGLDPRTTIMIRNIPNKYSQQMLIDFINESHRGRYDFLYLRMDFKNKCNVGYAFCNMVDVSSLCTFAERVIGKKWTRFNSDKVCQISYANIQGREALIEKFRNSSVMEEHPSYRPKIFITSGPLAGGEEPFPEPANNRIRYQGNYSVPTTPRVGLGGDLFNQKRRTGDGYFYDFGSYNTNFEYHSSF